MGGVSTPWVSAWHWTFVQFLMRYQASEGVAQAEGGGYRWSPRLMSAERVAAGSFHNALLCFGISRHPELDAMSSGRLEVGRFAGVGLDGVTLGLRRRNSAQPRNWAGSLDLCLSQEHTEILDIKRGDHRIEALRAMRKGSRNVLDGEQVEAPSCVHVDAVTRVATHDRFAWCSTTTAESRPLVINAARFSAGIARLVWPWKLQVVVSLTIHPMRPRGEQRPEQGRTVRRAGGLGSHDDGARRRRVPVR